MFLFLFPVLAVLCASSSDGARQIAGEFLQASPNSSSEDPASPSSSSEDPVSPSSSSSEDASWEDEAFFLGRVSSVYDFEAALLGPEFEGDADLFVQSASHTVDRFHAFTHQIEIDSVKKEVDRFLAALLEPGAWELSRRRDLVWAMSKARDNVNKAKHDFRGWEEKWGSAGESDTEEQHEKWAVNRQIYATQRAKLDATLDKIAAQIRTREGEMDAADKGLAVLARRRQGLETRKTELIKCCRKNDSCRKQAFPEENAAGVAAAFTAPSLRASASSSSGSSEAPRFSEEPSRDDGERAAWDFLFQTQTVYSFRFLDAPDIVGLVRDLEGRVFAVEGEVDRVLAACGRDEEEGQARSMEQNVMSAAEKLGSVLEDLEDLDSYNELAATERAAIKPYAVAQAAVNTTLNKIADQVGKVETAEKDLVVMETGLVLLKKGLLEKEDELVRVERGWSQGCICPACMRRAELTPCPVERPGDSFSCWRDPSGHEMSCWKTYGKDY